MRAFLLVTLVCCLAGCDAPGPANRNRQVPTVDRSRIAKAKSQYAAFVKEAAKGAALLESHPGPKAIRDEVNKLHEMLAQAEDVYPNQTKMNELADDGRTMMRYFDACLKVANFQTRRKDKSLKETQPFIDKTCDGNSPAIRHWIGVMEKKLGGDEENRPAGGQSK